MINKEIIGRNREITLLGKLLSSKEAELIAIYGRRRIGKTFLIRHFFADKGTYFECTGIKDGNLPDQLKNFAFSFHTAFRPTLPIESPRSWREAFTLLTQEIFKIPPTSKIIIFFDELPWLATRKSKFLQEFDYFWNTQWSKIANLKMIVCGSAASWMINHLINAKGGLHNRITKAILLKPFSLAETKNFLQHCEIQLTNEQVLKIFMVMGGVPYYLKQIEKNKSVTQNIHDICFAEGGLLVNEFPRLFKALFDSYEINLQIVKLIAKKRYGISIKELASKIGKIQGGHFNGRLQELEAAGFIKKIVPFGKKIRDQYYQICDEYTMFYLHWIEKVANRLPDDNHYWLKMSKSPQWLSWAGYAFEIICQKHISAILHALNLDHVSCLAGNWKFIGKDSDSEDGAQIDLVIDRDDGAITLCEMKYSHDAFIIDKAYAKILEKKINLFKQEIRTDKQIFMALITTKGLKETTWSRQFINQVVTLDCFFAPP